MLGSALAFSLMTVLVKLAGQRLPVLEIVLARALISLVLSFALIRRAGLAPLGTARRLLLLRGAFGCAGLCCVFYAVTHLPLAEATVIQYLHPTFTALLALAFLREHISPRVVLAGGFSFAGVVLIAEPAFLLGGDGWIGRSDMDPVAIAAAVGGAFLSGAAYIVVRRLSRIEDPLVIVLYFPLVTVPIVLPLVWADLVWPAGQEWLWLLGIGLTAQAGQIFLTHGLRHLPAARGTALSYSQVLFASCWGVFFFDEVPGLWTAVGALLIALGSFAVASQRERG
jgi:drug/metabolite transporter (DMT)-like permease